MTSFDKHEPERRTNGEALARGEIAPPNAKWKAGLRAPRAKHREPPPATTGAVMHVVFVPGFGGFDALGTVEYYPGTTEVAERWRGADSDVSDRVVLHYFDNLPTAGVQTRAERLLRYLQKRVARNEFREGDKISLVGHSTGGLDIRALLMGLVQASASDEGTLHELPSSWRTPDKKFSGADVRAARALLARISSVVFLSVPNRGTNIANWVRAWSPLRIPALAGLSLIVDLSDVLGAQRLDIAAAQFFERLRAVRPRGLTLWQALLDSWLENAQRTSPNPVLAARGREALAQLTLYLSQTHGDFLAIDDLAATDPERSKLKRAVGMVQGLFSNIPRSEDADLTRLARASEQDRQLERQLWLDNQIEVRSYATLGGPGVPADERYDQRMIPIFRALRGLRRSAALPKTDWIYRVIYAACAHGPFSRELAKQQQSSEPDHTGRATMMDGSVRREPIESWQNDGIVNTASMLWPNGEDTRLVDADHGDIIGHFKPTIDPDYAISRRGRKYRSYDIFSSNSGFAQQHFDQVWQEVFAFCAAYLTVPVS